MRDIACGDCVVAALITERSTPFTDRGAPSTDREAPFTDRGAPSTDREAPSTEREALAPRPDGSPEIGEPERRALRTLADAGLVPPLRLVLPGTARATPSDEVQGDAGAAPADEVPDAAAS
jgi:hypothetical protein